MAHRPGSWPNIEQREYIGKDPFRYVITYCLLHGAFIMQQKYHENNKTTLCLK